MVVARSDLKLLSFESTLKSKFSLQKFRPGQKEIIESIINKKDVMAVLPTGGGKSLCFQFPALYLDQLVIVISPLIALMKDQVDNLKRMGIPAGAIYSGQSDQDKIQIFQDIQKGGAYLLYLSPERAQKEGFQNWIKNRKIALFAIDEAHCVSQWGHDFREEYSQLDILKKLRPDIPTLALTASATPMVLADISKQIKLQNPEKRVHGFYRPNLFFQVEICTNDELKISLLLSAIRKNPTGRIIIYCGTRKKTEELTIELRRHFDQVGYYHAGLSAQDRVQVQEEFKNNTLRILIATNAFGMGIDQPDVRLVVHFQMPSTIDALYQEMGRAGRDGLPSTCLMLYAAKDKGLQSYFIQSSDAPENIKSARWRNLDALVNYSESSECRHSEILTYYQDSQRITNCGHCDNCKPDSDRRIKASVVDAKQKSKLKKKSNADVIELDSDQEQLFAELKKWRKQKASELDVPAFIILSDRTLRQIASEHPYTFDDLRNIHGIGEDKLERFGADLLLILN